MEVDREQIGSGTKFLDVRCESCVKHDGDPDKPTKQTSQLKHSCKHITTDSSSS